MVQKGAERQIVQLVRGRDEYGNFEIVAPPADAVSAAEIRKEADRRITKNVMPAAKESRALEARSELHLRTQSRQGLPLVPSPGTGAPYLARFSRDVGIPPMVIVKCVG